jgi:hypothetical protein
LCLVNDDHWRIAFRLADLQPAMKRRQEVAFSARIDLHAKIPQNEFE